VEVLNENGDFGSALLADGLGATVDRRDGRRVASRTQTQVVIHQATPFGPLIGG
jgi:hypothetical protein